MEWSLLALLAAFPVVAVGFALLAPLSARTFIRICDGVPHVTRGRLDPRAREHVAEILRLSAVRSGYIAITSQPRVIFSWRIPKGVRQQLRNVLLSHAR